MVETSQKIKLVDYLTEQYHKAFYAGIAERLYLAQEFINSYNDSVDEKSGCVWVDTYLLNPCTLTLEKLESEDEEDKCARYFVDLARRISSDAHDPFTNFEYVPKELFVTKHLIGGLRNSTNREVEHSYKLHHAIYTLSVILFEILFCCHPFLGREYYKKILMSEDERRTFFEQNPKFIFDYEDNPNRFVNGYHEAPWMLWNFLTDEQRAFWTDAFSGKIQSFEELYEKWHANYDFVLSQSKTPCGEKLLVIVFSDDVVLTISDNIIGKKQMRCKECLNRLISKCDACSLPSEKKVAQFLAVKTKMVYKPVGEDEEPADIVEKDIILYDNKEITGADLPNFPNAKHLFTAIASKKLDILGLKCMGDQAVVATCGDTTKKFEKDGIVPLFSGTHVEFGDYELIVPGVPPVKQTPNKPVTPQAAAVQPEASQPEASQPEASQPEASQPEASQPEASQPEASQPKVAPSVQTNATDILRVERIRRAEPPAFSKSIYMNCITGSIESLVQQFDVEIKTRLAGGIPRAKTDSNDQT